MRIVMPSPPPFAPPVILEEWARLETAAGAVSGIVRKVAKRYQELLVQNALMKGKLANLTVKVVPFADSPDMKGPGEDVEHTDGEFYMIYENGRIASVIELSVNVEDSPKFIAFVFAHELTHMLVDMQLDYCRVSGQSKYGCRPGSSCVTRFIDPEPKLFGTGMEESIADALAMYVVSRCRFSDKARTYAQLVPQWHHRQAFAHLLAAAFGDPLMKCKYIDEFSETFAPELSLEARVTEEGIEEEAQGFGRSEIRNAFWYCVAVNRFHMIIDAYNDTMGKGSWRELCRHMDAVQYDIYYKGAVGETAKEHQRQAERLIREFVQLCTRERGETED